MTEREALKLTLEALKQIDEAMPFPVAKLAIMEAEKALAQPEQEPVEWYSVEGETRRYGVGMVECAYAIGRDEVVHVVTHESVKDVAMKHLPTQRTWVGLTDDEIDQGLLRSDYAFKTAEAWRAGVVFAITKLKEKNA